MSGKDMSVNPFAWNPPTWGTMPTRADLRSTTDPSSTLYVIHDELRRALEAALASQNHPPVKPKLGKLKRRLEACEAAQAAHDRRLASLEARLRPTDTPAHSPQAPFAEHMARRIREDACRIPGVTAAYMQPDGLKFTLAGHAWTPDLSEAGAELAVKLQNEFAPDLDVFIDGGYEALGEHEIENWVRVFP